MSQLPTTYQNFIHISRYARWKDEENRRETWEETVDRYVNFMCDVQCVGKITKEEKEEIRSAILNLDVMPSMRALMTAGRALERDNASGFNCAHIAINSPIAFDELMYLLMCGCGVGISVERQFINELPEIAEEIHPSNSTITVRDSKIGWASGLRELISLLYSGLEPKIDYSLVRPAGSRLKTFGGRASGPEPLAELYNYTIALFKKAAGRKLTSIECHDLCCKIGQVVVVGGVRRSALISLSNLSDLRMRDAKSGRWRETNPERALANNSVAYTEKPEIGVFMQEWMALMMSKSGERGIFNRVAARKASLRTGRRVVDKEIDGKTVKIPFFVNPCGEIILRSCQFCNLSEVVIRAGDGIDDLLRKIRIATIIGTMQSSLTNFRYLRNIWKENTREEALLGVSLTGIMDHSVLSNYKNAALLQDTLTTLRAYAVAVNAEYAKRLEINPAAAITTVKPSGTVSQLVDSSSGIHPRFSQHYIRTVRGDIKDPLTQFLISKTVPWEKEVNDPDRVAVFSFPIKSPENCICSNDRTAIEQMELWLIYKKFWCEHNASVTIYVEEDEWLEVGAWVWKNFDEICGMAFLPKLDHVYKQAPYQEINKETYDKLIAEMPDIDFAELVNFEKEDNTASSKTLSCTGGSCEIVDIGNSSFS